MTNYTTRPATIADAVAINTHRRRIADEPNNTISYSAGEYVRTVAEERERLEGIIKAENAHLIIATADDELIGICTCIGGTRVARFTASLGISVQQNWRDQGVGTALMNALILWARNTSAIHRLELDVYPHNARARHIYRKLGFQEEGIRKEAFFKDGQFVDTVMMALIVDDARRTNRE